MRRSLFWLLQQKKKWISSPRRLRLVLLSLVFVADDSKASVGAWGPLLLRAQHQEGCCWTAVFYSCKGINHFHLVDSRASACLASGKPRNRCGLWNLGDGHYLYHAALVSRSIFQLPSTSFPVITVTLAELAKKTYLRQFQCNSRYTVSLQLHLTPDVKWVGEICEMYLISLKMKKPHCGRGEKGTATELHAIKASACTSGCASLHC